jgi:hypothetical protein
MHLRSDQFSEKLAVPALTQIGTEQQGNRETQTISRFLLQQLTRESAGKT